MHLNISTTALSSPLQYFKPVWKELYLTDTCTKQGYAVFFVNVRCTVHLIAFCYAGCKCLSLSPSLCVSVFRQLSWGHVLMELPITSTTLLLETVKGEPVLCSRLHSCFRTYVILPSRGGMVHVWGKDETHKELGKVWCLLMLFIQ